ncbi:MAG TPA: hypothetical protein VKH42_20535 [Vicinamibacterales bacterium]|nr:hypothetical protein [Vicinamibacterales bacterium]
MTLRSIVVPTDLTDAARCGSATDAPARIIYWHRELPPIEATALGEHTVEATSHRVPDTIEHREELWNRGKDDLMAQTRVRLAQEIARLGGRCAHVLDESIDTRHDASTGEAWLCGRFTYMLYR